MSLDNSGSGDERRADQLPFAASRRTLLKAAAATGMAASFGGVVSAQEGETFELDGFSEGWVGQSPDDIADEENPTLELEVGQTYVVEWTNADGTPHDFVILNADGDRVEGTDIVTEEGEVVTFEFEATEEMAQYYCSVHPATMRGEIELADVEDDEVEVEEELLIEQGPTVGLETVVDGLASPVDFQIAPEGRERYFIVDQPGQLYAYEPDAAADVDDEDPDEQQDETETEEPATVDDLELFLDVSDRMPELGMEELGGFDERGLLGVAFHPDFEENGRVFVRYSGERGTVTSSSYSHTFVLSEFQADENGDTVDLESERRLLEVPEPQFNHNAGPVAFGPDGYLYVAIGDGGDGDDTGPGHPEDWYEENEGGSGQNTRDTLLGGILRIDVDTEEDGKPYGIPEDNPFVEEAPDTDEELDEEERGDEEDETPAAEEEVEDEAGADEADEEPEAEGDEAEEDEEPGDNLEDDPAVLTEDDGLAEYYAWGMRNPWGMSFTEDGELLAADVGQLLFEIINHVERGGNYGWNVREGVHCFDTDNPGQPPEECPDETPEDVRGGEPLLDPVIDYPQEYDVQNIGSAVVGGQMYTNDTIPELQDAYVFGDWSPRFEEPLGRLFVSHPPEGWEDGETPDSEESFAAQAGDADHPLYEEELWEELWPIEELRIEADDDLVRDEDELDRFVLAFGTDADGEVYVLTSEQNTPDGETGQVHRLVSAEETDPEAEPDEEEPEDEPTEEEPEPEDEPEAEDEPEEPEEAEPEDEPEAEEEPADEPEAEEEPADEAAAENED